MITELTQKDVYFRAPSVFAETPAECTSDRYSFLSTKEVLSNLSSHGYAVVDAKQSRGNDRFHTKHSITFTHRDNLQSFRVNEVQPRIVLINSHDGKTSYKLRAGLFRLVCTNGLTVSDGCVQSISIRHAGHEIEEVLAGADTIRRNTDKVLARVEDFKARTLELSEIMQLTNRAIDLRYGEDREERIDPSDVVKARRYADASNDLWAIFNRVQENIIRGGFQVGRLNENRLEYRRAKEIKAIDQLDKINTSLWEAAEGLVLPA